MTGRILCLGDSLTYGFGLPRGLVWTALCAAQTGAELLGGGVNGNTTGGMLAVLPDLLVREHPDAVLLMGGTNDIAYGGDLAGARANMGAMAHLIIAGGGLPLIGIPPGLRRPIRREWAELMPERAAELLEASGRCVKLAVLMGLTGLEPEPAKQRLEQAGGRLHAAIDACNP